MGGLVLAVAQRKPPIWRESHPMGRPRSAGTKKPIAHSPQLTAHNSRLMAHGSRLTAHGADETSTIKAYSCTIGNWLRPIGCAQSPIGAHPVAGSSIHARISDIHTSMAWPGSPRGHPVARWGGSVPDCPLLLL
jgi:hypothetical protein